MRVLGYLLVGCVACAALQAAVTALVLTLLVGLIVGIVTRPAETLGFVVIILVADLFKSHPLLCFGFLTLALIAGAFLRSR